MRLAAQRFRASEEKSGQSFLPAGLCVEVSLPISVPLRFSIPVALVDGLGLWVELVLPMPSAEGEPAPPSLLMMALRRSPPPETLCWSR